MRTYSMQLAVTFITVSTLQVLAFYKGKLAEVHGCLTLGYMHVYSMQVAVTFVTVSTLQVLAFYNGKLAEVQGRAAAAAAPEDGGAGGGAQADEQTDALRDLAADITHLLYYISLNLAGEEAAPVWTPCTSMFRHTTLAVGHPQPVVRTPLGRVTCMFTWAAVMCRRAQDPEEARKACAALGASPGVLGPGDLPPARAWVSAPAGAPCLS